MADADVDVESDDDLGEELVGSTMPSLSHLPVMDLGAPIDPPCADTLEAHARSDEGAAEPRRALPGSDKVDGSQGLGKMMGLIGKSLSTISMPVNIHEPLDAMQRLCEELHFSALLDQAAAEPDPLKRLLYVAAFAISGIGTTFNHAAKPFNPLLGSTFECVRPERGFRFIAEQVSHHPPVTACQGDSKNWGFAQEASLKTSFRGSYLRVTPLGEVRVTLKTTKEVFVWRKCVSTIDNILNASKRSVSHYGKVAITNTTTGDVCRLDYAKPSRFSKSKRNDVSGAVFPAAAAADPGAQPKLTIIGKWHDRIQCPQLKQELWSNDKPRAPGKNFGFTDFAMELNQPPAQPGALCPTDTRFRPDQRLLESGDVERAQTEKLRLEELQRSVRAKRHEEGASWTPRFFAYTRKEGSEKEGQWVYKGNFWAQKAAAKFDECHQLW